MGGTLSGPILTRFVDRVGNEYVKGASSSAQGYRLEMEDAHIMEFDINPNNKDAMCFGVFDGHGGPKASEYIKGHLSERLRKMKDVFDESELIDTLMQVCTSPSFSFPSLLYLLAIHKYTYNL